MNDLKSDYAIYYEAAYKRKLTVNLSADVKVYSPTGEKMN
jgi:hypothetical protein